MELFDAHCHLTPGAKAGPIVSGPRAAGRILCGVGPGEWPVLSVLAREWPGTVAAYGVHPWQVSPELPADWAERLEACLAEDAGSWLGEAGLERRRRGVAGLEAQEAVFRRQLGLAARLGRRANLHCVGSWELFLSCLDSEYLAGSGGAPFIVHGFGGPYQYVGWLAERGAYFTVGPLMAGRDSRKVRERAALLPLGRVLLESDEFLEPGRDAVEILKDTLSWFSLVRGVSEGELGAMLCENIGRLFDE